MHHAWRRNRLTALLGIDYPIIQGPLGGLSSQRLTAAVSNFGGLGSFGAHTLAPEAIRKVVAELRGLTSKPFAMNLWVSMEDEGARTSDEAAFRRSLAPLAADLAELGVPAPPYTPYAPLSFEVQVATLIEERVPVISFIFGLPSIAVLRECRERGIVTIGTATTPEEAVLLEEAGVDAIAASGFEAGGHRGSFLRTSEDSLTGSISLVPRIVDRVELPVIAAGGIADARGVAAAFALGAEGVQLGSAFLACDESGASPLHRAVLHSPAADHTALTRGFSGRLARGVRNRLLDQVTQPGAEILPYPLQRGVVRPVAMAAEAAGRSDLVPLWAGQSTPLSKHTDATVLLRALVEDVGHVAGAIAEWSVHRRLRRT
jgi:nitronate monooxygenase